MTTSLSQLLEESFQISWEYLERTGELGDGAIASRFLSDTIEVMIRRGQRSRLGLSNRAITAYRHFRSRGATDSSVAVGRGAALIAAASPTAKFVRSLQFARYANAAGWRGAYRCRLRAERKSVWIDRRKSSCRTGRSSCGGTQQRQQRPRLPLPHRHRSPDTRSRDSRPDSRRSADSLRRALRQRRRPEVLELRPRRRGSRRHPDRHLRRAEPRHHRGSSRR